MSGGDPKAGTALEQLIQKLMEEDGHPHSSVWRHPLMTYSKDPISTSLTTFTSEELQSEAIKLFKVLPNQSMLPLCGNLRLTVWKFGNFLPLRFYVKSILADFRGSKMVVLTIFKSLNYDFWKIHTILLHDYFEGCIEIANPKGVFFFIPRGEAPRDEKFSPEGFAISMHPEQCSCSSISVLFAK